MPGEQEQGANTGMAMCNTTAGSPSAGGQRGQTQASSSVLRVVGAGLLLASAFAFPKPAVPTPAATGAKQGPLFPLTGAPVAPS